jgi:hypothetical protein
MQHWCLTVGRASSEALRLHHPPGVETHQPTNPLAPHHTASSRPSPQAAQKKMLDVINSVGLGESVLRMIERRHKGDTYIAVGGMVRRAFRGMKARERGAGVHRGTDGERTAW